VYLWYTACMTHGDLIESRRLDLISGIIYRAP
jgi:hypothetical protein